jgi:hypothetical protein
MRWPWGLRRAIEPRPMASSKALELQAAMEILEGIFHTPSYAVVIFICRILVVPKSLNHCRDTRYVLG